MTLNPPPLAALADQSLEDLRAMWRAQIGPPPKLRSRELLALMLAWRLQSGDGGGLDEPLRKSLARNPSAPGLTNLSPGTVLTRDWQGRGHTVTVTVEGEFQYEDKTYDSLSSVARAITGTRWNGPRFFGLRTEATQ